MSGTEWWKSGGTQWRKFDSLGTLNFVSESLHRFPNYHECTPIPKAELKLQIQMIKRIRWSKNLEEIVETSKKLDQYRTQHYWRVIFGIIYIEWYQRTEDVIAILHAMWRLSSFGKNGRSLILKQYSTELLDICKALHLEAYERWFLSKE